MPWCRRGYIYTGGEVVCEGARDGVLPGEPSGQPGQEAIHGGMDPRQVEGAQARGTLLCLRPPLPQTHPHMDQHAMDTEGIHRHRTMRAEVQVGQGRGSREVGAQVETGTGQLGGEGGQGPKGHEKHAPPSTTQGTAAGSTAPVALAGSVGGSAGAVVLRGQEPSKERRGLMTTARAEEEWGERKIA